MIHLMHHRKTLSGWAFSGVNPLSDASPHDTSRWSTCAHTAPTCASLTLQGAERSVSQTFIWYARRWFMVAQVLCQYIAHLQYPRRVHMALLLLSHVKLTESMLSASGSCRHSCTPSNYWTCLGNSSLSLPPFWQRSCPSPTLRWRIAWTCLPSLIS